MPYNRSPHIMGEKPWGRGEPGIRGDDGRELAPQQNITYHCGGNRGRPCPYGTFTVPFAAGVAELPAALDCRCGGTGRLDGTARDAEVDLPGYGQPTGGKGKGTGPKDGMDPWGQLMKRRTVAELDAMLAERLAEVRQSGVAR